MEEWNVDIILGLVMGNLLIAALIWVANCAIERHDAKKSSEPCVQQTVVI